MALGEEPAQGGACPRHVGWADRLGWGTRNACLCLHPQWCTRLPSDTEIFPGNGNRYSLRAEKASAQAQEQPGLGRGRPGHGWTALPCSTSCLPLATRCLGMGHLQGLRLAGRWAPGSSRPVGLLPDAAGGPRGVLCWVVVARPRSSLSAQGPLLQRAGRSGVVSASRTLEPLGRSDRPGLWGPLLCSVSPGVALRACHGQGWDGWRLAPCSPGSLWLADGLWVLLQEHPVSREGRSRLRAAIALALGPGGSWAVTQPPVPGSDPTSPAPHASSLQEGLCLQSCGLAWGPVCGGLGTSWRPAPSLTHVSCGRARGGGALWVSADPSPVGWGWAGAGLGLACQVRP